MFKVHKTKLLLCCKVNVIKGQYTLYLSMQIKPNYSWTDISLHAKHRIIIEAQKRLLVWRILLKHLYWPPKLHFKHKGDAAYYVLCPSRFHVVTFHSVCLINFDEILFICFLKPRFGNVCTMFGLALLLDQLEP